MDVQIFLGNERMTWRHWARLHLRLNFGSCILASLRSRLLKAVST